MKSFFLSILFLQVAMNDGYVEYASSGCDVRYGNYTKNSLYNQNLDRLFSNLSSHPLTTNFYSLIVGEIPNKIYGMYQCREDITPDVCNECVKTATKKIIQDCPLYGEATVWYYECILRYANRSNFFTHQPYPSTYWWSAENASDFDQFSRALVSTLYEVTANAALDNSSRHFATKEANLSESETLYALAQCNRNLPTVECNYCLSDALSQTQCCTGSIYAMLLFPTCQLRYSTAPFYVLAQRDTPPVSPVHGPSVSALPTRNEKTPLKPGIIVAIASIASLGFILLVGCSWLYFCQSKPEESFDRTSEASHLSDGFEVGGTMDDLSNLDPLQFDFKAVKAATNNFAVENKLGQGGFGEVYKGRLSNGEDIAVKRLSKNSQQGELEFKNEVLLLAKLQHRNLVRLLGFCILREEKILIYEFLSNSSLDHFLYDPLKRKSLDWALRFKIITGIARGLLYLHEDSRLKIIHRDLKVSNILLDETMNAKIADFGIAKLFDLDQTQGDTMRIAGTYGYMAPEYALAGQFSVKSDVYSFGVIVLEIITGQRNSFFQQKSEGLIHRAWRLWNEDAIHELIDPLLANNCSEDEVKLCIQLGLLCIQEDAAHRPRMASVVAALSGQAITLPVPNAPHFYAISSESDKASHNYDSMLGSEGQYSKSNNSHGTYAEISNISEISPR